MNATLTSNEENWIVTTAYLEATKTEQLLQKKKLEDSDNLIAGM